MPGDGLDHPVGFVLRLGRAFHAAGYPAHRLEQLLKSASDRLGLEGQFFSTPTSLLAAFGPLERQHTHIIRVDVGSVNLARLAALDVVARDVESGRATPAEGSARIDAIETARAPWGTATTILASAVASATGARLLGGGAHEIRRRGGRGARARLLLHGHRPAPADARTPRIRRRLDGGDARGRHGRRRLPVLDAADDSRRPRNAAPGPRADDGDDGTRQPSPRVGHCPTRRGGRVALRVGRWRRHRPGHRRDLHR